MAGFQLSKFAVSCFQSSHCSCSNCYDCFSVCFCCVNCPGGFLCNFKSFECILCSSIFSHFTGRKVPSPTFNVTYTISTPLSFNFFKISSVKCSPAVGAATEPSSLHKPSGIFQSQVFFNIFILHFFQYRAEAEYFRFCAELQGYFLHR